MMKSQHVALAFGLILISAQAAPAQTAGTPPCITGHKFEPGPIVNGHHRQPTAGEIEARTRELRTRISMSAGSCLAVPHSSEATMLRPPRAASPDRIVDLDLSSSQGTHEAKRSAGSLHDGPRSLVSGPSLRGYLHSDSRARHADGSA
jgi:hypothetical protein